MADEFVISDETGEKVPVQPVQAVLSVASVNQFGLGAELPADAAKLIEQAMAAAAGLAIEEFGHDADKIKEAMLSARASMRTALLNEQREVRSREQAGTQER